MISIPKAIRTTNTTIPIAIGTTNTTIPIAIGTAKQKLPPNTLILLSVRGVGLG